MLIQLSEQRSIVAENKSDYWLHLCFIIDMTQCVSRFCLLVHVTIYLVLSTILRKQLCAIYHRKITKISDKSKIYRRFVEYYGVLSPKLLFQSL